MVDVRQSSDYAGANNTNTGNLMTAARIGIRSLAGILSGAGLALASANVSAQERAAEPQETPVEVTITGSRIARPETAFANPVVSVSAESIQLSGSTNIAELLTSSPALVGSVVGNQTGGSYTDYGETGLNLLDLRNLGVDRTLVLVDGRRHVSGLAGSAAVDIDAIPTDLIEAIDVLTGGASAIYGADGVSGVVNFRMKRDFEGITTRAQIGNSRHGDGGNRFGSITMGHNFAAGRGNVAFAYEYNADDRVPDQSRAFLRDPQAGDLYRNQDDLNDDPNVPDNIPYYDVRYADSSRVGAIDIDGDGAPDFEGNGSLYDRGFILEGSGGYTVGGSSTPTAGYQGDLFPKLRRNLANALGHYDFNDGLSVFFEGKYVESRAYSVSQPTFDYYLLATPDNPFMPDAIRNAIVPGAAQAFLEDDTLPDGALVTRDNYDLGINAEDVTRRTLRTVIGANGRISDRAKYEVSYVYGETKSRIVERNNRVTDLWLAAIDVVTDPGTGQPVCRSSLDPDAPAELASCVPYNLFGEHTQDPAALKFILTDSVLNSTVSQHVVSGSVSGDFGSFLALPGGSIGYAVGAEYRRERSDFRPDALVSEGLTWAGALQPISGEFSVKEAFAEVNLPLLENRPFAKLFSVGAAIRLSDYDTIGSTTTWKVDSVYAPTKAVSFRGTYSQAVRAPNIGELFAPPSSSFNFIVDPCDTQELNNGSSTREANCAALLQSLGIDPTTFSPSSSPQSSVFTEGLSSGNLGLSEETAKTWTAGVVLRPSFVPALTVTADWYDIRIAQAINTPEAEQVANLCVDQPTLDNPFCVGITRDPGNGFITGFTTRPENVAAFTTSGLDLTATYAIETDTRGAFDLRLIGGYLHRLTSVATPGAEVVSDRRQQYKPRYVATFDLTWRKGPITVNYTVDWYDKTKRFADAVISGDPDYVPSQFLLVKEKWEHSAQFDCDLSRKVSVYTGVHNLFDEKPAFGVGYYSSYPVSAMGRFFYAGLKASL
jgi:iron complex outermembrane recepter protein